MRESSLVVLASLWLTSGLAVDPPTVYADADPSGQEVRFLRDIRPILSDACFTCHGPDENTREADLRFDLRAGAFADLGGYHAIVPGKPAESELYVRIAGEDEDMRMPPVDSGKRLTKKQIELVRRWIEQGAEWEEHWSFIPPERPPLPKVKNEAWPKNPNDHFVLARLEKEGINPSAEADRTTLIRRATIDLTGLPPTIEEVDTFLADDGPGAYERLIDRLLASPHYGEQMTRYWLDAARYGDTHGLHLDNERSIWPYRDWLIKAFNDNKPFDQFAIEQLAGDLLPDPTLEQRIATGFNRCNVTTSEGGSIAEEYIVRYAVDRTETMGTVFLGLTIGCCVCHEHKFDPVSQKEFYQLYAFFNSTADKAMDGNALLPPPVVKVPAPEQTAQKKALEDEIASVQKQIQDELAKVGYVDPKQEGQLSPLEPVDYVWIEDSLPPGAQPSGDPAGDGQGPWHFVSAPSHPVHSGEKATVRTAQGRSQHFFTGAKPGLKISEGDKLFAYVYLDPENPPQEIMFQFNDGSWEHRAYWGEDVIDWGKAGSASRLPMGPLPEAGKWVRLEVEAAKVGLGAGAVINGWAFTQFDGSVYWDHVGLSGISPPEGRQFESQLAWEQFQGTIQKPTIPKPVHDAIKVEQDKRNDAQKKLVREYFLEHVYSDSRGVFDPLHQKLDEAKKKLQELEKAIPATLVTVEMDKPRDSHVLERGQYDKPAEKVDRDVPAILPPLSDEAPRNRLGLAQWLTQPSHPLTSRVTVNRFWQQYFGTGIVKTAEDFGSQGEWPSHPDLLDWLSVEFMESGWDVKRLQKLIVMSATYRQSSRVTPELHGRDPDNRLLARGPRFRMDAETVRDNTLAISGLLVKEIGGPSVKPYQPLGLWKAVGYTSSNTANFKQDHGGALYRRSMYTFWKRTSPPPTMLLLDAPSRETCTVRRARTNTPLAALALLNDPQFFEAARKLAERMMVEGGSGPREQITFAFRLATARQPDDQEIDAIQEQYSAHLAEFQEDRDSALAVLSVGEAPRDESLDVSQLAAWTMVANTILNLDETVTKM
jgi:hypothetical protein